MTSPVHESLAPATRDAIDLLAHRYERELLEEVVRVNPQDIETLIRLGELYSRSGRLREGLSVDLRLVTLAPVDPIVRYNLACSLSLTGRVGTRGPKVAGPACPYSRAAPQKTPAESTPISTTPTVAAMRWMPIRAAAGGPSSSSCTMAPGST